MGWDPFFLFLRLVVLLGLVAWLLACLLAWLVGWLVGQGGEGGLCAQACPLPRTPWISSQAEAAVLGVQALLSATCQRKEQQAQASWAGWVGWFAVR